MFSLAHASKNEFNIEQNLWIQKAKKEQECRKRWHSGTAQSIRGSSIKAFKKKVFYSHTLVITEQGSPLERLLALEYEQKFLMRAGGMTNNLISSKCLFEAHTNSGETDHQQWVSIPNTLWWHGRRIRFAGKGLWQKFSNLPCKCMRKQLIPGFWPFRCRLNILLVDRSTALCMGDFQAI